MLFIRNLRLTRGETRILDGCDLDVRRGHATAVIGRSGAGKTSLLRLIAGLDAADAGELTWNSGRPRIAMMFQDLALWPVWPAGRQIREVLRAAGCPRKDATARLAELCAAVRLIPELLARRIDELSGGERQRVALARCLAQAPELLLLDEPFANLDPPVKRELLELFRSLLPERTIVLVTHSFEEAAFLADSVAVLAGGRIVQQASPMELRHRPASVAVSELLAGPPAAR